MSSTVLLVEDQADLADLWAELLRGAGWDVVQVGRLDDARARAFAHPTAVAVVDWTLPDGTSERLIGELAGLGTRVIVSTGYGAPVADLALAAGATLALQKPFNLRKLLAAVGPPVTDPTGSPPPG